MHSYDPSLSLVEVLQPTVIQLLAANGMSHGSVPCEMVTGGLNRTDAGRWDVSDGGHM